MVVAFLVGACLLVVLAVLATALVARRRAVRPLQARLEALIAELTGLRVSSARLEERLVAAGADADRLRRAEADLTATLAAAEQEKARLDYELRQVGLVASRVPELEHRLVDRDRLAADLTEARARIAELEPATEELELRNQFIETLQRELVYRDERSLALERRVDQLAGVVEALGAGDVPAPSAGPGPVMAPPETAAASSPPGRAVRGAEVRGAEVRGAPVHGAGVRGPEVSGEVIDEELPPVGRALEHALHGLGVRSFADLAVFDEHVSELH